MSEPGESRRSTQLSGMAEKSRTQSFQPIGAEVNIRPLLTSYFRAGNGRLLVANRRIAIPNSTPENQFSYSALFCHALPHDPPEPARMTAPSSFPAPQGRAQCAAFVLLGLCLIPIAPHSADALHQLAFHASPKIRKNPCISPPARLSAAGPDSPRLDRRCDGYSARAARRPLLARLKLSLPGRAAMVPHRRKDQRNQPLGRKHC